MVREARQRLEDAHVVLVVGAQLEAVALRDDEGDLEAGIWYVGASMGLINDIPTVAEVVSRIVDEADELITERLADLIEPSAREKIPA